MPPGRILYVNYSNPCVLSPLEHSSRMLADAGWYVMFLGTGAYGADALRFPEHPRIDLRRMPYCPPGLRQKLHYIQFLLWVLWWTIRWRPAWVYASDVLACIPALLATYVPGVQILYHEHDSPDPATPTSLFGRVSLWARERLARRARLNVLPNEQRTERYKRELHPSHEVLTVWNCPRRSEAELPHARPRRGQLTVVYQGSLVPHRLPPTVLDALAQLPDVVRLQVVGYQTLGFAGYMDTLRSRAEQLGIERRVEFLASMPLRADLLTRSRQGDVGLCLVPLGTERDVVEMVGASQKAFEYLACGLTILVSDHPSWRRLYVDTGFARACDPADPASIAAAIRWFLEDTDETWRMGECARQRVIAEWNYQTQFRPVLDRLENRAFRAERSWANQLT